jgi:hypothetical protein
MLRIHPSFAAAIVVVAAASTASAQELVTGTYRSTGRHGGMGEFTGDVTLDRAADGYALRGRYRFSGGRELTWTGTGRREGSVVRVSLTFSTPGLADAIGGTAGQAKRATGTFTIGADGKLVSGSWRATTPPRHRVRETLTLSTQPPPTPGPTGPTTVDLQVMKDNQIVPENLEESEGMAVSVNIDDDDNDGGRGGDGEVRIVRDFDDPNGTPGENDLIEVRVAPSSSTPAGAQVRFDYNGDYIAVYRDRNRQTRQPAGATFSAVAGSYFVEGRAHTPPGSGARLSLEVVQNGQVSGRDAVTIHVARSAFILVGHGGTGGYGVRSQARSRAIDRRQEPWVVRGKEGSQTAYWSVYVWETEKHAKIALSTPGAVIAYDGHSNFGMGFAFEVHFARLSQFMNIADHMIPVNWPYLRDHQEHPSLDFSDAEYGDDPSTGTRFDPTCGTATVETAGGPLRKSRWGAPGQRFSLTRGERRWFDHHYGEGDNVRIVVQAGSRDMPEKKWSKLFLNSCYSGSYYYDSFGGHGTLFMTTDEASSSSTSACFLFGFIDGKSNDQVNAELNAMEDINTYRVFTND